ncbi:MAG: transglutaminase-like domain-containing protein, partial [Gemmataceae bacterium]|nr:transglutaminase-like domain-containing protein [Gemmataceae bacterium]
DVYKRQAWMRPIQRDPLLRYGPVASHRIKIASLKGALIPTPPLLERFRVGRLNRPDFFTWEFDGVLRMDGRKSIPSGTIVSTDSFTLAGEMLADGDFALLGDWVNPDLREAPGEYQLWAERWAGDRPHGWPQIEAVVRRLREDFTLDPQATAPDDCPDPVAHFFQTRRGPDYLFASAATLILRRLGYPARLVLGYYAAPDSFDPVSRHTPVRRTDLHFWTEVLLRDGRWLVVEPTPGYDVLRPARPWLSVLKDALVAAAPTLALLSLAAAILWWRRRDWMDWLRTARFRVSPGATWRKQVLHCLWLIEQRGRWAGLNRTPQQTFTRWTDSLPDHARTDRDWNTLVSLGEWASYSDQLPPPIPPDEVRKVCRRVVDHWTIRRFRGTPTGSNRRVANPAVNPSSRSLQESSGA